MSKPGIIVTSHDDDDTFRFLSDGWYELKRRHLPEAQVLMARARAAIEAGQDVPDTIRLLQEAGFEVTRDTGGLNPEDIERIAPFLGESC